MSHSFFEITPRRAAELALAIGAELRPADAADLMLSACSPVEDAVPGSLSFVDNPRYARHLATTAAAAVICPEKFADKVPAGVVALIHSEPYRAYAAALDLIYPGAGRPEPVTGEEGVSPRAHVCDGAFVEEGATIEAGAVIGLGAEIGRGARILANAVIGKGVKIGRNTTIGPNASVTHAYIGDNVIIHAGARIGQDGFGFAMSGRGHRKVAQVGRVIIQDHVEIGANTTIDRGSNRDTVIGEGTKIDNLVQIGHNVNIGRHCVIVGLAGIAGSATLEDFVVIAGQAGIGGHTTVHAGAQVGGGAGTHTDIAAGDKVIGYPAMPVKDWVRLNMVLKGMIEKKPKGET